MPKPLIQRTGRRKEAVARVRLRPGSGVITVNGRQFEQYFPILTHRVVALEPLRLTQTADVYDVDATHTVGAEAQRHVGVVPNARGRKRLSASSTAGPYGPS